VPPFGPAANTAVYATGEKGREGYLGDGIIEAEAGENFRDI
jgi:hypothetical protein